MSSTYISGDVMKNEILGEKNNMPMLALGVCVCVCVVIVMVGVLTFFFLDC